MQGLRVQSLGLRVQDSEKYHIDDFMFDTGPIRC